MAPVLTVPGRVQRGPTIPRARQCSFRWGGGEGEGGIDRIPAQLLALQQLAQAARHREKPPPAMPGSSCCGRAAVDTRPPPREQFPTAASVGAPGSGAHTHPSRSHPAGQAAPETRGARNRSAAVRETYNSGDRPQCTTGWVLASVTGLGGDGADVSAPGSNSDLPGRRERAWNSGSRAGYRGRIAAASRSPRRGLCARHPRSSSRSELWRRERARGCRRRRRRPAVPSREGAGKRLARRRPPGVSTRPLQRHRRAASSPASRALCARPPSARL